MAKPIASDVSITVLGLISFSADLVPLTESARKEQSFRMVCPDCEAPTPSQQGYTCSEGHGPYSSGQMRKALEVDRVLSFVTQEEIADVKQTELPAKVANFGLYPSKDVLAATYPTGAVYRLRVEKAVDAVKVVTALVKEGTYRFVAEVNLGARSGQKLFQLAEWCGHLVIEELARPELVSPLSPVETTVDAKLIAKAGELAATQVEDFDPTAFSSKVRARAMALADSKRDGSAPVGVSAPTVTKVDPTADLMDLLTKALGA